MNKAIRTIVSRLDLSHNQLEKLSNYQDSTIATSIPWYVRLVTIVGALFASVLFVGFLAISQLITSETGLIVIGTILIILGVVMAFKAIDNPLTEPFIVAMSFLGQILFASGFYMQSHSMKSLCVVGIFIEITLFIYFRNQVQRFFSVILIFIAVLGLLWNTDLFEVTHLIIGIAGVCLILCFHFESRIITMGNKFSSFFGPTTFGLVFVLFVLTILCINNKWFNVDITRWWISSLILFGCIAVLIWTYLHKESHMSPLKTIVIIACFALLLSPTAQTPGVSVGILILLLGFKNSCKQLLILGVIFFALFITAYYYSMQVSLLFKSYIMFSTGILFIISYIILRKRVGVLS